jgi:hypothetical protein
MPTTFVFVDSKEKTILDNISLEKEIIQYILDVFHKSIYQATVFRSSSYVDQFYNTKIFVYIIHPIMDVYVVHPNTDIIREETEKMDLFLSLLKTKALDYQQKEIFATNFSLNIDLRKHNIYLMDDIHSFMYYCSSMMISNLEILKTYIVKPGVVI